MSGPVPARRGVSEEGRATLARAVQLDHDWGLPHTAVDELIAVVGDLDDGDLEGAHRLAHRLAEALECVLINRDMGRDAARRAGGAT